MTSGLKHVLIAQIRALASTSYAIFHIVCPFHIVHLFFIFLFDNFSNFKAFVYISFIFPTNDAFFSFIQQFIQFHKENYLFKKLFIQKIWNYSFKEIIHSLEVTSWAFWLRPLRQSGAQAVWSTQMWHDPGKHHNTGIHHNMS